MQLNQAEAIKFAVENWRIRKFKTAGTLFWQWNDCWNVISWSAIDYRKRPKALYYFAKKFFNPVFPVLKRVGDLLKIYIVNDLQMQIFGELTLKTFTTYGVKKFEKEINVEAEKNSVALVFESDLKNLKIENFQTDYVHAEFRYGDGKISENSIYFEEPKFMKLKSPGLKFKISKVGEDLYRLKLYSKNLARAVFIDFAGFDVELSDNFFDINPGSTVEIELKSDKALSELLKSVRIKFLT